MRPHCRLILLLTLGTPCCFAGEPAPTSTSAVSPQRIEVFTVGHKRPIRVADNEQAKVRVFVLDGIRRLETKLSHGLPADPRMAEREVLRRLKGLDEDWQARAKASAQALLRARELGVERYPAIVFDEQWVIYGLTDLDAALRHYRDWQGERL